MSTQLTTPIESMFDFHRTLVHQQQSMMHDAIEAQRTMMKASEQGFDAWRKLMAQNNEFARTLTRASIANVEGMLPEEFEGFNEAQRAFEEQLDLVEEATDESFEFTESAFDEAETTYEEFVDAFLEAYDAGIEAYLEATGELQTTTETVAETIDIDES